MGCIPVTDHLFRPLTSFLYLYSFGILLESSIIIKTYLLPKLSLYLVHTPLTSYCFGHNLCCLSFGSKRTFFTYKLS